MQKQRHVFTKVKTALVDKKIFSLRGGIIIPQKRHGFKDTA